MQNFFLLLLLLNLATQVRNSHFHMLLFCEDNLELILAHLELLVLLSCLLFHLDKTLAVEIHAVSLRFFEFLAHGIIHRAMTGALRYGVRVRLHLLL